MHCDRLKWIEGCICSASVYRLWSDGRVRGGASKGSEGLYALCSLLVRRAGNGGYSMEYAHVRVPVDRIIAMWELDANATTETSLAAMANAAAKPGTWPLHALENTSAWKALHCVTMAVLRDALKYEAFYVPLRLGVDANSGLVVTTARLEGASGRLEPKAGILRVDAHVPMDRAAVAAVAMQTQGGISLAYARMVVLKQMSRSTDWTLKVEIVTKDARFYHEYNDSFQPPSKRNGSDAEDIFATDERFLTVPGVAFPVKVRTMVPKSFDCLVTSAEDFSAVALLAVYRRWYENLYGKTAQCVPGRTTPPIFTYVGPELLRRGETRDYAFTIGFPGWSVLKAASATPEAVKAAVSAYADTDGLWPMSGPRVFQVLAPWAPRAPPSAPNLKERLSGRTEGDRDSRLGAIDQKRLDMCEQWCAGRLSCIFREPTYIGNTDIAKLDFSAFFPSLYLAMFPQHTRLRDAVSARLSREKPWLKAPLVEFFGMLKRTHSDAYDAVIQLANYVSFAVEDAAEQLRFGICNYIKDGFWGAFAESLESPVEANADPATKRATADVEALRLACETAANDQIARLGLSFPAGVRLTLRTEGTFTKALSWNVNCYWLRNKETGAEDFVGFLVRPEFATAAKAKLGEVLDRVTAIDPEADGGLEQALSLAKDACDSLVRLVFERRWDDSFWTIPSDSHEDSHYTASIVNDSLADADHGKRRAIRAVTAGGDITTVTCSLYAAPAIVPAIPCLQDAERTFRCFCHLFNGALRSKWELSEEDAFEYDFGKYAFLFVRN
ncbi:helicase-primase subunit [Columbid alphaherpesvirus 1]|uniref:Helicase-primase subunit n=1 Tax=Columbid alphaherpesvirus 1 TaxID=93386 RepID=A0A1V0M8E4_9ALPH|nr:helicase-primase subunit [Columbid alphaherpesvirus 1]ARD71329.1 helicase-primase subunit [Columbid alphaherpesvirus 1]